MNSSLELGKIMGIPVRLHWTLLLVILYVTWALPLSARQSTERPMVSVRYSQNNCDGSILCSLPWCSSPAWPCMSWAIPM